MRQVLVDHARRRASGKRGGEWRRVTLDRVPVAERDAAPIDVLALEEALLALEESSVRQSRLVELRFFAGMTLEESAAVLDVSVRAAKNDWRFARAFLSQRLREASGESELDSEGPGS